MSEVELRAQTPEVEFRAVDPDPPEPVVYGAAVYGVDTYGGVT